MTSIANITGYVSEGLNDALFGDPLLTAIFMSILLMVILWRYDVSIDGSILIMISWFLVIGGASLFPQAFTILVWMAIGVLLFMILLSLFRKT